MNWELLGVVLFYACVFLIIYLSRKRFDIKAKIFAFYRTRIGINLMDRLARMFPCFFRLLGNVGIGVGFVGMAWIVYTLIKGVIYLAKTPGAGPTIQLLLPGITVPLWTPLLAIFILAVVHEFSHGIQARLSRIKVKSTGLFFAGPIIGAFVEPDEKQIRKMHAKERLAIFAAGSFANLALAVILMLLFGISFGPVDFFGVQLEVPRVLVQKTALIDFERLSDQLLQIEGFRIKETKGAAERAGLKEGMLIKSINGIAVGNESAIKILKELKPGQVINIVADNASYEVKAMPRPENASKGMLGISFSIETGPKKEALERFGMLFWVIRFFIGLVGWVIFLNVAVGLFNLLPLGIVDGGRILRTTLYSLMKKGIANAVWKGVSFVCLLLIVLNFVMPYLRRIVVALS